MNSSNFTGAIAFALLLGFALAVLLSYLLVTRYKKAIIKGMSLGSGPGEKEAAGETPHTGIVPEFDVFDANKTTLPDNQMFFRFKESLGWHMWVIILATAFYSVTVGYLVLKYDGTEVSLIRMAAMMVFYSGPMLMVLNYMLAKGMKQKVFLALSILFVYLMILWIIVNFQDGSDVSVWQLYGAFIIYNALPVLLTSILRATKIRSVGLIVFAFAILTVFFAEAIFNPTVLNDNTLAVLTDVMHSHVYIVAMIFGVAALSGFVLIKSLKNLYKKKILNELQLTVDAYFIIFTLCYAMTTSRAPVEFTWKVLLPFAVYKFSILALFWVFRRRIRSFAPKLLLLRVFALGDKSRDLLDKVRRHWQFSGPIQMITGPDLAVSTLDLHEMIAFVTNKLKQQFCTDEASIKRNMDEVDLKPDLDGTYRVNEFFCRNNTWKEVLKNLVSKSDVVLMDLRSFSEKYKGCQYEIQALVNSMPMQRMVFLIDVNTRMDFLEKTLREAFDKMSPNSPNHTAENQRVFLFDVGKARSREIFKLVNALCEKASAVEGATMQPKLAV